MSKDRLSTATSSWSAADRDAMAALAELGPLSALEAGDSSVRLESEPEVFPGPAEYEEGRWVEGKSKKIIGGTRIVGGPRSRAKEALLFAYKSADLLHPCSPKMTEPIQESQIDLIARILSLSSEEKERLAALASTKNVSPADALRSFVRSCAPSGGSWKHP